METGAYASLLDLLPRKGRREKKQRLYLRYANTLLLKRTLLK